MDDSSKQAYLMAVAGGAALWLAAAVISGSREAWDSSLYWIVAYPLSIGLAAVLGYRFPERAWRWGLAVMLAQAVTLAVTAASFGLLPLGLVLFAVLAMPAVALAGLAAKIRRRTQDA